MNAFDLNIMHFLNGFSNRSPFFDSGVVHVMENNFLTGGILMALFWWAWFSPEEDMYRRRALLLTGMFASILAVIVARALALSLPFRARPLNEAHLGFRAPFRMDPTGLIDWSSFPSDHAALFFGIASALWLVSRRLGMVAFCDSLFVINLPRVYTGVHYPTDIIAGAILGIGIVYLVYVSPLRKVMFTLFGWLEGYPGALYSLLFLCTFEVGEVFDSARQIAIHAFHMI